MESLRKSGFPTAKRNPAFTPKPVMRNSKQKNTGGSSKGTAGVTTDIYLDGLEANHGSNITR